MWAAASISVMDIPRRHLGRARPAYRGSTAACRGPACGHHLAGRHVGSFGGAEVEGLTDAAVHVLDGGTDAWHAFGRPLVRDKTTPPDEACIDFYLRPYDRNFGIEDAMNAYLSWEIDLVHEIERDGTIAFGLPGETHAAA